MKQTDLIVLGLAGVAVYMIVKSQKGGSTSTAAAGAASPLQTVQDAVQEIFDTAGKAFDNGWRYFSDGTTIDPSGNYYSGGQLVWRNTATLDAGRWL